MSTHTDLAPPPGTTVHRQFVGQSSPTLRRRSLAEQLDREWQTIAGRRANVRRARQWHVTTVEFDHLDELLTATGYRQDPADQAAADRGNAALGRLVGWAATDELAARIVFQRIVHGLHAEAAKRVRAIAPGPWFDEIVPAAWIGIRTYPVERRPQRIACNLIHDAAYRAFNAPRRRRSWGEATADPTELGDLLDYGQDVLGRDGDCDLVELGGILAEARRRGLGDDELDEVRDLVRFESSAELAAHRGVTPRAVRYQRARLAARLRDLTEAA